MKVRTFLRMKRVIGNGNPSQDEDEPYLAGQYHVHAFPSTLCKTV